jgi:hypothetical protein
VSLTGHLKNPRSPVRSYISSFAATVADAKQGALLGPELQRVLGLDRLPSKTPSIPSGAEPRFRGTVGTAFDYRVRFYFPHESGGFLVASLGAATVADRISPSSRESVLKRFRWFIDNLDDLVAETAISDPHSEEDERLLCRYCAVLAEFEAAGRSAFYQPALPRSTRRSRSPIADEPLLEMASEQVVEDLLALSRSVTETFGALIDAVDQGVRYIPNPVFDGSGDVGGADADFIIGDTMFELKTQAELDKAAVRQGLLQGVGYALLDYSDVFKVRSVGLYFARHEWVAGWPLWLLVFPPAKVIRHLASRTEPSEDELVERLTEGRAGLQMMGVDLRVELRAQIQATQSFEVGGLDRGP